MHCTTVQSSVITDEDASEAVGNIETILMARETVEETVERLWGEGAVVDIVVKSGPFGL